MDKSLVRRVATRWIVSPDRLISSALTTGLISIDEADDPHLWRAAESVARELADEWPEGEGFGSSDTWSYVRSMLSDYGVKTDYRGGRLTRLAANKQARRLFPEDCEEGKTYLLGYGSNTWSSKFVKWIIEDGPRMRWEGLSTPDDGKPWEAYMFRGVMSVGSSADPLKVLKEL